VNQSFVFLLPLPVLVIMLLDPHPVKQATTVGEGAEDFTVDPELLEWIVQEVELTQPFIRLVLVSVPLNITDAQQHNRNKNGNYCCLDVVGLALVEIGRRSYSYQEDAYGHQELGLRELHAEENYLEQEETDQDVDGSETLGEVVLVLLLDAIEHPLVCFLLVDVAPHLEQHGNRTNKENELLEEVPKDDSEFDDWTLITHVSPSFDEVQN
jgi:hypothetical protein